MRTRSALAAVAAGMGMAGMVAARRRAEHEADSRFYARDDSAAVLVELDGVRSGAPLYVHDMNLFGSLHPADPDAVGAVLPAPDLHPVRLPDGRGVVFVGGIHYREMTAPGFAGGWLPYGEVIVAALVSRAQLPPVVPLAAFAGLPLPATWRAGMFYLFVPVTHRWTRDAGWTLGFPKFVADLEFGESPETCEVRASEAGRSILRLRVPTSGPVRVSRAPLTGYTASRGRLLEFVPTVLAHRRTRMNGRGVELELGSHEVADRIRALGVAAEAIASFDWVAGRAIIPQGGDVGAARPFVGYLGDERWFGRYTIQRGSTPIVDQYGYLTRAGIERGLVAGGARPIDAYSTIDGDLGVAGAEEPEVVPAR